jgi:predicted kinase
VPPIAALRGSHCACELHQAVPGQVETFDIGAWIANNGAWLRVWRMHLNPDNYLQTDAGRIFTAERNAAAWTQLYADLSTELKERPRRVVMVIGVQGAGKSTWTKKWTSEPGDAIYVDSTFATVTRRSRVIAIAKTAGVEVSAVWVKVSLETALRRNRERPTDEVVPDDAVENVFRIFEPPSLQEGFQEVFVVGEDVGAASLVDRSKQS